MTRRLWALLLCGAALALGACGGGDEDESATPEVPEGSVAVVGGESISNVVLEREVAALRRSTRSGDGRDGRDSIPVTTALEQQALSNLLLASAVEQEARTRGITVSREEARQRWEVAAGAQFPTARALRRFLRGQSRQAAVDQLRLQMLNEEILQQVSERAGGGNEGARAAQDFQRTFQERWRKRISCADDVQAGLCAQRQR